MRGRYSLLIIGFSAIILVGLHLISRPPAALWAQPPFGTSAPPPFLTPGNPPFNTPGGPPIFGTPGTPLPTVAPATPTNTATSPAPGCNRALPIPIGSEVTVRPGVNIRAAPSVSSALVANFPENRLFTVTNGPVCGDDYVWWQIEGPGVPIGWVAEANISLDFIRSFVPPDPELACANPLVYQAGQQIELVTGLRVRAEPGLGGQVLTVAPTDAIATVLNPDQICADGYNWVNVAVTVANFTYEGWMVESSRPEVGESYIEGTPGPESICRTPRSIAFGSTGRVRYNDGLPKNLRADPRYDGEVIFTLVEGVPLQVIGGPVCSGDMNWWLVQILATIPAVGWLAEGPPPNYWFSITNDVGADRVISPTPTDTPQGGIITPTGTFNPAPTATTTLTYVPLPSFTPSATATGGVTATPLPTFVPTGTITPFPTTGPFFPFPPGDDVAE